MRGRGREGEKERERKKEREREREMRREQGVGPTKRIFLNLLKEGKELNLSV